MKLLVTGGAGFIGSNFILRWLAAHPEDELINLDALTYAGTLAGLESLAAKTNYRFVRGDITDTDLVRELVTAVDAVVHFAAESHVDRSIADSAAFMRTNVLGTHTLLEAARIKNTRFHHISTDEVFGSLPLSGGSFSESTAYDPHSPYSASKAASDHLVRAYWHTYGLPVTISNCSNNYGPRQFPEKLIPLAITNLLMGKNVPVYGTGSNVRDWIFVDDHNAGVEAILLRGKIGQTYCLGGQSESSNLALIEELVAIMGGDDNRIDFVADRPGHDLRYAINFAKIQRELSWQPQVSLAAGLAKTVAWYQDNESWWRSLQDRLAR